MMFFSYVSSIFHFVFRRDVVPEQEALLLADGIELLHKGLTLEEVVRQFPRKEAKILEPLLKASQVIDFVVSDYTPRPAFENDLRARFLTTGKSNLEILKPVRMKPALVATLSVAAAAIVALVILVPLTSDSSATAEVRIQLEQVQARIDIFTDKQAGGELSESHFEDLKKDLDKLVDTVKDQPLTQVEQARVRSLAEQSVTAVSEVVNDDENIIEAAEAVIERAGAVAAAVANTQSPDDSETSQGAGGENSVGADGGGVSSIEETD